MYLNVVDKHRDVGSNPDSPTSSLLDIAKTPFSLLKDEYHISTTQACEEHLNFDNSFIHSYILLWKEYLT